ncbi:hypothetical protein QF025_006570 [Paraburkholderia graminis]|uniref:Uncharacterized protein n=1 Tax=Paraburkholderia graminis TaxID=60548 RepID=A0ABD5CRI3_9BURK|nr:hypothetical protein [Paraburkholderia graminis]
MVPVALLVVNVNVGRSFPRSVEVKIPTLCER